MGWFGRGQRKKRAPVGDRATESDVRHAYRLLLQRDPDPARTKALREILEAYARGDEPLAVLPLRRSYFTPLGRALMGERLKGLREFKFVTCDDFGTRPPERHGERVARVCHYRLETADETRRYVSFWLRADGVVVDFWSSPE